MDPISITTAALAFIEALKKTIDITSNACKLAKTLAEKSKEYRQISQHLGDSVIFLQRLFSLKETIARVDDDKLKAMNIPTDSLLQHLENTEALNACLQKQRPESCRGFKKLTMLAKLIIKPESADESLQHHFRQFLRSFNSISILLNAFQSFAILSVKESQITHHDDTIENLNALSSERRLADVAFGSSLYTTHRSVRQIQKTVSSTGDDISRINESVGSTAADVKCIHQSISETRDGITKSLLAIDNSINTFNSRPMFTNFPRSTFGVPYPRNRWFTGRRAVLTDIQHFLRPEIESEGGNQATSLKVFVVHGLPGIGKTNLAVEFGHRHKNDFSHIFWISADSDEKFGQGLITMARSLGLVHENMTEEKEKIISDVIAWLNSCESSTTWLLVLDNVEHPQVLNPILSNVQRGCVLVTSRDPIPGMLAMTMACRTSRLRELTPDEGTQFIQQRLGGNTRGDIGDDAAADLARRFAYFPLYMDQMTSFIETSALTLAQFYEQADAEFGDHELQDLHVDSPWYTTSLAKAIESHITKHSFIDPQARGILTAISFFDPDSIPERLLLSLDGKVPCLSSSLRRQKILLRLSGPSFIYVNPGDSTYERCISIHRLVRDAALRSDLSLQTAFEAAVSLLRTAFPLHKMSRDHMMEDWVECEIFEPHVLSLHSQYLELRGNGRLTPSFEFIELVYSCAWYLCERGRLSISEKLISSIYEDYNLLSNGDSATPAAFLADVHTVQLFFHNEAVQGVSLVELATKAMDVREEAVRNGSMDEYHPNRANGPMNVGVVMALEDPRGAIEYHTRALAIRLGSDKYRLDQIHGLALNYLNIGRCWWMVGDLVQATSCFEQSLILLRSREAQVGKRFSITAWVLAAMGIVRAEQDNLDSAMELLTESLEFHVETMGAQHIKTLTCYYRLGWVCYRMGDFGRANQLLSICLDAYAKAPTPPKAVIARTKFQLSRVLKELGSKEDLDTGNDMEKEAIALLGELRRDREAGPSGERTFTETDFDEQVVYFLR